MTDTQTHYRTCNICEAMCGLEIKHRGNEILSIKGDNNDPFSHGHICPKAVALQDFYNDEDRLKTPMWRTADGWQEISWDEAFREIASRFRAIQQEHGQDAVGVGKRLKAIQQRGGKVVVVDPRRTETAKKADQHLFIRPETDALFMLALVHTLFEEQLVTLGHLEDRIDGLEPLAEAVKPYSPETVAETCGMSADAIRELAREMAGAKSAVCCSRMGASTQSFGGLCQWLNNVLNILTGNFDSRGGAMFPQPAFDLVRDKKGKPSSYGRYGSRVRKLPYFNNEFPVATLADEILTSGEGQIRAMMTIAGNPVLSAPGGARLEEAFDNLDFMVSVDIYLNETTRHADIILPATTGLEDDGVTPEAMLDLGLRHGAYGKQGMSLEKLNTNPHGLDLGPLQPCLEQRIQTGDSMIRIAPMPASSAFKTGSTPLHQLIVNNRSVFPARSSHHFTPCFQRQRLLFLRCGRSQSLSSQRFSAARCVPAQHQEISQGKTPDFHCVNTWYRDFHPTSLGPCLPHRPAHAPVWSREAAENRSLCSRLCPVPDF